MIIKMLSYRVSESALQISVAVIANIRIFVAMIIIFMAMIIIIMASRIIIIAMIIFMSAEIIFKLSLRCFLSR